MGIVNAAHCVADVYEEIDKELLQHVEDVLLNRSEEATEKMLDYAATLVGICRVWQQAARALRTLPSGACANRVLRLPTLKLMHVTWHDIRTPALPPLLR